MENLGLCASALGKSRLLFAHTLTGAVGKDDCARAAHLLRPGRLWVLLA
jgi:hypothetical protein